MAGRGLGRGNKGPLPPGGNGGGAGRGRGRGVLFSSDHFLQDDESEDDVPVTGLQREREDATLSADSSSDDDNDFITAFRKLHSYATIPSNPSMSADASSSTRKGTGRGRRPDGGGGLNLDTCYPSVDPPSTSSSSSVYVSSSLSSASSSGEEERLNSAASSNSESRRRRGDVVSKRGDKGQIIPMTVNFVRLEHLKEANGFGIWEYHVDFDPPLASRKFRWVVLRSLKDVIGPTINFDGGSKLFLPLFLGEGVTILEARHPSPGEAGEEVVQVTIKFVKKQGLEESVHFYNILLRQVMEKLGLTEMQRNFFDHEKVFQVPEHRLEIWPGYVTAIEVYEDGLMLNCDSSFRVLRTDTMLDALDRMFCVEEQNQRCNAREQFREYALGKIVLTRYNNKHYRVDDVDWGSTPSSTFPQMRGGNLTQVSFIDYYRENYGLQIQELGQPMLVTRGNVRRQQQATDRGPPENILLVPELCFVTGMTEEITSDFRIMKVVADKTRIGPMARYHALKTFIKSVNDRPDVRIIFEKWGLKLADGVVQLNGRKIVPPRIIVGRDRTIEPREGEFNRDLLRNNVLEPVAIQNWLLICTAMDDVRAKRAIQNYAAVAPPLGIVYRGDPQIIRLAKNKPADFRQALVNNIVPGVTQFVMVIIPANRDDLYRVVKTVCNHEVPVQSQVIRGVTLMDERKVRSVMQKVALQINCKLGGGLWTINILLPEKIMFLGMDVYHDPRRRNRSVTAVVSTINWCYTKYYTRVIFQQASQENISSLRPILVEALQTFCEENRAFPDRVIMFRDGVGDGQLELTKQHEVAQMHAAFEHLGISPLFTFVVVQKRINARLFMKNESYIENVPPGTVLDHTVTRRNYFDFFLVSQLIREGTVNPTHYIVLYDNSEMKPDIMQKFAYVTSFMYYNWAGAIRVPAMCQYAHKAAGLVGQHIGREPSPQMNDKLYYL